MFLRILMELNSAVMVGSVLIAAAAAACLRFLPRKCEHAKTIETLKAEVARLDNALKEEQVRSVFYMARLIYAFGEEATRMDGTQFVAAVGSVRSALEKAVLVQAKLITQKTQ